MWFIGVKDILPNDFVCCLLERSNKILVVDMSVFDSTKFEKQRLINVINLLFLLRVISQRASKEECPLIIIDILIASKD